MLKSDIISYPPAADPGDYCEASHKQSICSRGLGQGVLCCPRCFLGIFKY